jgi:hypothetical protein
MNGPIPDGYEVDHINQIPHDNRINNLRLVTHSQNQQNRRGAQKNNLSSGVRGVHFEKSRGKWRASIGVHGGTKFLGRYDFKQDAEAAYAAAAAYMHSHNPAARST